MAHDIEIRSWEFSLANALEQIRLPACRPPTRPVDTLTVSSSGIRWIWKLRLNLWANRRKIDLVMQTFAPIHIARNYTNGIFTNERSRYHSIRQPMSHPRTRHPRSTTISSSLNNESSLRRFRMQRPHLQPVHYPKVRILVMTNVKPILYETYFEIRIPKPLFLFGHLFRCTGWPAL